LTLVEVDKLVSGIAFITHSPRWQTPLGAIRVHRKQMEMALFRGTMLRPGALNGVV
jgi:hypothetical protein